MIQMENDSGIVFTKKFLCLTKFTRYSLKKSLRDFNKTLHKNLKYIRDDWINSWNQTVNESGIYRGQSRKNCVTHNIFILRPIFFFNLDSKSCPWVRVDSLRELWRLKVW